MSFIDESRPFITTFDDPNHLSVYREVLRFQSLTKLYYKHGSVSITDDSDEDFYQFEKTGCKFSFSLKDDF